jgi:hypothetical protein
MIFRMQGRGSRVWINSREFNVGGSITIDRDGTVTVDGVAQDGKLVGPVDVMVHGNVDHVETTSGRVEVSGQVGSITTMSGDVRCGNVTGSVFTMSGDVTETASGGPPNR